MVLDLIIIGLAITLEPIPLTAFLLVLASKGGTTKAGAFIAGWIVSLGIVVALTLLVTGNQAPASNTAPATGILAAKIVIGALLVLAGTLRWRKRGQPKKPKDPPKWQTGIDTMSPAFAFVLGPLVQPWGLVAAGVANVMSDDFHTVSQYLALALFLFLSVSTYVALEAYALLRPAPTQALITRIRGWVDAHQDQVIIWIALAVGIWLVAKSTYQLVS